MNPVLNRLPPLLLSLGAATWIALQITGLDPSQAMPEQLSPSNTTAPIAHSSRLDFSPLGHWDLFGAVPRAATADRPAANTAASTPATATPPLIPTSLKLRLQGVLLMPHRASVAIIRDDKGREQGYRLGDTLPGGGRITTIDSRQVMLHRAGRLETLALQDQSTPGQQTASAGKGPRRVIAMTPRGSGIRR